jgi:hypothetical protein
VYPVLGMSGLGMSGLGMSGPSLGEPQIVEEQICVAVCASVASKLNLECHSSLGLIVSRGRTPPNSESVVV